MYGHLWTERRTALRLVCFYKITFTLSLASSSCLTTTMSASSKTRVTELSNVRAARTIAPRSPNGPSEGWYPSGSVAAISHNRSMHDPVKIIEKKNIVTMYVIKKRCQEKPIFPFACVQKVKSHNHCRSTLSIYPKRNTGFQRNTCLSLLWVDILLNVILA